MKIGRVEETIKPSLEVRNSNRELAQLVERHPYKVDVAGSNPVLPTNLKPPEGGFCVSRGKINNNNELKRVEEWVHFSDYNCA